MPGLSDNTGRLAAAASHPWRAELRNTLRLAVPLVLTQLAVIAIGTTDTLMMGWLGPQDLAAGALGGTVYFAVFLFSLGVLTAVAPMAAQAIGAHQRREVRRIVRQGLWVATTLAVPFGLVLWHTEAILLGLGQTPANAALAGGYLHAMVWGLLPALWFLVLRNFVAALSRPRAVVVVTVVAVGLNALGNYGLMFGNFGLPRLELVGAGISSSVVNTAMFAALLAHVLRDRGFRCYTILVRLWRPDWARFRAIFRVGLPIGGGVLLEVGMFSAAAILMGLIGTDNLAAHQIALQLAAVTFMVPLGISHAVTVRVGLATGARDAVAVGRRGWVALTLGAAFMSVTAVVFWLFPRPLVDLFLDLNAPASAPVVELATSLLAFAAVFQIADGTQVIATGALRGLKDTRVPMLIAGLCYWGVGFTGSAVLAFPLGFGSQGVWAGLVLGLFAAAALMVWRFQQRHRFMELHLAAVTSPA